MNKLWLPIRVTPPPCGTVTLSADGAVVAQTLDGRAIALDPGPHDFTFESTGLPPVHSRLVLLHVADGWAARTYGPDAVSREITEDATYLDKVREEFQSSGIPTEAELAYGDPVKEIIKWVEQKGCDLVAMSTHGHRFLADLFLGATATRVQHSISIPVLLLRAK